MVLCIFYFIFSENLGTENRPLFLFEKYFFKNKGFSKTLSNIKLWLFPKKPKIFSADYIYGALQIIL